MVFEASGVDEAADGVAGEVTEAQGDAAGARGVHGVRAEGIEPPTAGV